MILTIVEAAELLRLGRLSKRVGPRFRKVDPGKRARLVYCEADLLEWIDKFGFGSTSVY